MSRLVGLNLISCFRSLKMFLSKVFTSVSRAFRQFLRDPRVLSQLQSYATFDKKFQAPILSKLNQAYDPPKILNIRPNLSRSNSVKKSHRISEHEVGFACLVKAVPQRCSTYVYKVDGQPVACHVMLNSPAIGNSKPGSIATTHSSEWSSDEDNEI